MLTQLSHRCNDVEIVLTSRDNIDAVVDFFVVDSIVYNTSSWNKAIIVTSR